MIYHWEQVFAKVIENGVTRCNLLRPLWIALEKVHIVLGKGFNVEIYTEIDCKDVNPFPIANIWCDLDLYNAVSRSFDILSFTYLISIDSLICFNGCIINMKFHNSLYAWNCLLLVINTILNTIEYVMAVSYVIGEGIQFKLFPEVDDVCNL